MDRVEDVLALDLADLAGLEARLELLVAVAEQQLVELGAAGLVGDAKQRVPHVRRTGQPLLVLDDDRAHGCALAAVPALLGEPGREGAVEVAHRPPSSGCRPNHMKPWPGNESRYGSWPAFGKWTSPVSSTGTMPS